MTNTNTETAANNNNSASEMYYQIYRAGGAAEPVSAMDIHNATIAAGYTRDEAIAALNVLIADADIVITETFTGMVATVRFAS